MNAIQSKFAEIAATRNQHLESFAAAYLKMTDIDPDEAVLVEEWVGSRVTWRFERKGDLPT